MSAENPDKPAASNASVVAPATASRPAVAGRQRGWLRALSWKRPPRWLRKRSSIGLRLGLLALALGLPFIVYVGGNAARQASNERKEAKEHALSLARLFAARVDDYVGDMVAALALVGHGVDMDPSRVAANDAFLQRIQGDLPRSVNNVGIWTLDGRNIGALDRERARSDVNIADRDYFRAAARTRKLAIEGPIVSRANGEPIVQFARPVQDAGGNVAGIVTVSVRLRDLQWLLDPKGAAPPDTVVSVVNAEGVVLARSVDPAHWIGRSVLNVGSARAHLANGEGVDETRGIDNVLRIAGYTQASRVPWHIFVGMPAAAALSSSRANLLETLIFGTASLLVGAALAAWLGVRIARPLRQLAYDAALFARGNLAHRTSVAGDDETGVLANTLNRLAQTVQDRTRALQEKTAALEEKTAALATRERFIRLITDGIPARITYSDTSERLLFGNRRFAEYWGSDPDAIVGRRVGDVVSAEAYAQIQPELVRSYRGESSRFDLVVDRPDGTQYYQVDHVPDVDAQGRVHGVVTISQDVTDLRDAQAKAEASEQRLRRITDNIPSMVGYIDRDRRYRFNSRYYETWLKRPLSEITGRLVSDVLGPQAYAAVEPNLDRALAGERVDFDVEVKENGRARFVRGTYIPDFDAAGVVIGVYASSTDITPLKEVERQLERLAQNDTLTGLPNRHMFNDGISAALRRSQRSGTQVALLFLDIDGFKRINDTLGHAAGDDVLREFARRLSVSVRVTDLVARLAGDEFVIVLEGIHTREECRFVARKIIAATRLDFRAGDATMKVTTSIGIALGLGGATTPEALLKRADSALYAAKGHGRDRFEIAI